MMSQMRQEAPSHVRCCHLRSSSPEAQEWVRQSHRQVHHLVSSSLHPRVCHNLSREVWNIDPCPFLQQSNHGGQIATSQESNLDQSHPQHHHHPGEHWQREMMMNNGVMKRMTMKK